MANDGSERADSAPVVCSYCDEAPATINVDGIPGVPLCLPCRLFQCDKYSPALEDARRRAEEARDRERHARLEEAEFQRLARQEWGRRAWESYEAIPDEAKVYPDPRDGNFYRTVPKALGSGRLDDEPVAVYEWEVRRVALTLDEAREHGWDYFHPEHGWIRYGRKPERDHPDKVGTTVLSDGPSVRQLHIDELRRLGGQYPLPRSLRDDLFELEDRRADIEREIGLAGPSKALAQAFGERGDGIDADEQRNRAELQKIDTAIAVLRGEELDRLPRADAALGQRDEAGGPSIGYGAFQSSEHFLRVMKIAVPAVRARGLPPSQPNVSQWLCEQVDQPNASIRTLKYHREKAGLRHWDELIAQVDADA